MSSIEHTKIHEHDANKHSTIQGACFESVSVKAYVKQGIFRSGRWCIKEQSFEQIKKQDIGRKFLAFFSLFFREKSLIMAESWPKYLQEEPLNSEFDYATHPDTEELAFLNYATIPQEQIVDINDDESCASANVSTPSDSSEEETQQWRSIVKQLDLEMKVLKETYVWHENNVKSRLVKIQSRLEMKSKWVKINLINQMIKTNDLKTTWPTA